jgi:hypothetical protein
LAANNELFPQRAGIISARISYLNPRIKPFLKRLFAIGFLSLLGVTAVAYAFDYAVFRYRLAANHNPFGQVTIQSYDAVQQKSGKIQFIFNPPENQTCVHALFPRAGFLPCWYLQRNTEPRTNI